jgi:hypothetical protein
MWWLRELRYSKAGKLLMLVLVVGLVGGLGYAGYHAFGTSVTERTNTIIATEQGSTTETSLPLTTRQAQCRAAIEQLDRLVKKSLKFSNLDENQSELAFRSYAKASRDCTYSEFIEYERSTILPWAAGQDLYTTAQQNGSIESEGGSK